MSFRVLLFFVVVGGASAQTVRLVPTEPAGATPSANTPEASVPSDDRGVIRPSAPSTITRQAGAPSSAMSQDDVTMLAKIFLSTHPSLHWGYGWVAHDRGMDPVAGRGTLVFFEPVSVTSLRSGDLVIITDTDGSMNLERFVQADTTGIWTRLDHGGRTRSIPSEHLVGRVAASLFANAGLSGNTDSVLAVLSQY